MHRRGQVEINHKEHSRLGSRAHTGRARRRVQSSVAEFDGGVGALVLCLLRRGLELLAPVGRLRSRLRAREHRIQLVISQVTESEQPEADRDRER